MATTAVGRFLEDLRRVRHIDSAVALARAFRASQEELRAPNGDDTVPGLKLLVQRGDLTHYFYDAASRGFAINQRVDRRRGLMAPLRVELVELIARGAREIPEGKSINVDTCRWALDFFISRPGMFGYPHWPDHHPPAKSDYPNLIALAERKDFASHDDRKKLSYDFSHSWGMRGICARALYLLGCRRYITETQMIGAIELACARLFRFYGDMLLEAEDGAIASSSDVGIEAMIAFLEAWPNCDQIGIYQAQAYYYVEPESSYLRMCLSNKEGAKRAEAALAKAKEQVAQGKAWHLLPMTF